jgi:hypothetical protein
VVVLHRGSSIEVRGKRNHRPPAVLTNPKGGFRMHRNGVAVKAWIRLSERLPWVIERHHYIGLGVLSHAGDGFDLQIEAPLCLIRFSKDLSLGKNLIRFQIRDKIPFDSLFSCVERKGARG